MKIGFLFDIHRRSHAFELLSRYFWCHTVIILLSTALSQTHLMPSSITDRWLIDNTMLSRHRDPLPYPLQFVASKYRILKENDVFFESA